MIDRERERGRDTGRGRSRLHTGSPNVGLDPWTPGSCPGPKAGAKLLSHPGIPYSWTLKVLVELLFCLYESELYRFGVEKRSLTLSGVL